MSEKLVTVAPFGVDGDRPESTGRDRTDGRRTVPYHPAHAHRRRPRRAGHPRGPDRPARAAVARARARASRRSAWIRDLAPDDRPASDRGGPPDLGGDRAPGAGGRDGDAVRDGRGRDRSADRQQPLHEHRPRASPARDRLDVDRATVAADRREPRGEAADADARVRGARLPPGRVQDRLDQRGVADRRCSGSARRSRASSGSTWSCPATASGTRPGTASIDDEWPAVKAPARGTRCAADRRSCHHRRVEDRRGERRAR